MQGRTIERVPHPARVQDLGPVRGQPGRPSCREWMQLVACLCGCVGREALRLSRHPCVSCPHLQRGWPRAPTSRSREHRCGRPHCVAMRACRVWLGPRERSPCPLGLSRVLAAIPLMRSVPGSPCSPSGQEAARLTDRDWLFPSYDTGRGLPAAPGHAFERGAVPMAGVGRGPARRAINRTLFRRCGAGCSPNAQQQWSVASKFC
jgi:hypothetical protein